LPAEQGVAWSRLLNDCAAADLDGVEGFVALATVPLQDPVEAAFELRRAVEELGMRGVMIDTNVAGRSLLDLPLDPFWEMVSHLGVPVVLHPFNTPAEDRLARFYLNNVVAYPYETTLAAAEIIFSGLLDRFPGLRVLLVHGGGFLPYQIGRLDRAWLTREENRRLCGKPPSAWLRSFYYDTLSHDAASLRFLIDRVGFDRVLLGSDFPFGMGDPNPARVVENCGVDALSLRAILWENAKVLFRLTDDA
jgi:aminocarboxymuconate-semialdehyde decarboxylase